MADARQMRRRVENLHKKDPRCRRCGKTTFLTQLPGQHRRPDAATVQHRYPRGHPRRVCTSGTYDESRTTLYCRKCNQQDNEDVKNN